MRTNLARSDTGNWTSFVVGSVTLPVHYLCRIYHKTRLNLRRRIYSMTYIVSPSASPLSRPLWPAVMAIRPIGLPAPSTRLSALNSTTASSCRRCTGPISLSSQLPWSLVSLECSLWSRCSGIVGSWDAPCLSIRSRLAWLSTHRC